MSITATELKENLAKYLKLAETQDILITKNGRAIAKLSNPYINRIQMAQSLFGLISSDADAEEAKEERLLQK